MTSDPKTKPSAEPKSESSSHSHSHHEHSHDHSHHDHSHHDHSHEAINEPKEEPSAEPKSELEKYRPEGTNNEPTPEPKSEPKSEGKAEPKSEPKTEPKSEPKSVPKSEPNSQLGKEKSALKEHENFEPYAPRHDFSPMDCTDIVIGTARGSTSRIWDYYTRDRSTPRVDSFWGGRNDITAAIGDEKDGITTIAFRKKLIGTEPTDHSIIDDEMHIIWAAGQDTKAYKHFPESGLEKEEASIKDFYREDELKYHGHGDQRGILRLNFFGHSEERQRQQVTYQSDNGTMEKGKPITSATSSNPCRGEWSTPKGCEVSKGQCEYHIQWRYSTRTDYISFSISTTHTDSWTGVGFSDDHKMPQTDSILGWVDQNGRPFVMDAMIRGYTYPQLDSQQDVHNVSGSIADGVLTINFARKRITDDSTNDLQFTDSKCLYLVYPVKGGAYNPVSKKIKKHESIPVISTQRICIRNCVPDEELINLDEKPTLQYNVEIKLLNVGQNFHAPAPGTPDFDILSNTVSGGLKKKLSKFPGFQKLDVIQFTQGGTNVVTKLSLEIDEQMYDTRGRSLAENPANELEKLLQETVSAGTIGALTLDKQYLIFEPAQLRSTSTDEPFGSGIFQSVTKLWIVVGCIAALVVIAIVQAGCTIYRINRRPNKRPKQDHMVPSSAWKDYSTASTNYAFDAFESEEKQQSSLCHTNGSSRSTMPLRDKHAMAAYHVNTGGHYGDVRSLHRSRERNGVSHHPQERSTYSLPRPPQQPPPQPPPHNGYYTQRPTRHHTDSLQPDFYFMPSQRKYSGEVVRVYVDYNTSPRK